MRKFLSLIVWSLFLFPANNIAQNPDCPDLSDIDFGPCAAVLGYANINGACTLLSGCSSTVDGIDYSAFIFSSPEECASNCAGGCMDLIYLDFGPCEMLLGYAKVNGECVSISGCSPVINGFDFSPYIYDSPEECELVCLPLCMDLYGLDFGPCDMFMGYAMINGSCVSLSGCGSIIDGVDYSEFIYDSEETCINHCQQACLDLVNLDFGECAMPLGIAVINGECEMLSGCGYEINGVNYENYFFESMTACENACISNNSLCVIPEIIDSTVACTADYTPVCGCDGQTYSNACVARNYAGITNWTMGECTLAIQDHSYNRIKIYPNPCDTYFIIENANNEEFNLQIYDLSAKRLLEKDINSTSTMDISYIKAGIYLLMLKDQRGNSYMNKLIIY